MEIIAVLLLGWLCLLMISLQRTYARVPVKELRRRARQGDDLAGALYKATAYGYSLRFILWALVGLTAAVFFVFVARNMATWFAVLLSGLLIWLGFVWLPAAQASAMSERAAAALAPLFAWLLNYLHGPISRLVEFVRRHRPVHVHTGLYERADLLDLLDAQAGQTDNRIDESSLRIARGALLFGDLLVRDAMTPRRMVKTVSAQDDVGPVFLTELHESGHSRFPVYEGKQDNFVGTLFLRDLVNARASGKVKNKMHAKVLYLHEDQSLRDALSAILKTHHHLYVVVNSFEEYVGIITIEDVLEKILGRQIIDEFDTYEDIRAVARITADKQHDSHLKQHEETEAAAAKFSEAEETIELD